MRRIGPALCLFSLTPAMVSGSDWDPWIPADAPPTPAVAEPATAPGVLFGLAAIRVYQAILSPALGGGCQFELSCSRYAFACIESQGLIRGIWAGADRISRCHGFAALGGYLEMTDGRLQDPPGR